MFRTLPLALLAGASILLSLQPASAIDGAGRAEPTVVYADQMPLVRLTAYGASGGEPDGLLIIRLLGRSRRRRRGVAG